MRDKKQRKVKSTVSEGVFDDRTLYVLEQLLRKEKLQKLVGIISRGKEANVYYGKSGQGDVAVKIYSVDASDFRKMGDYIRGDPRFSIGHNRRDMIYTWARKEYANLKRVYDSIRCPKPIAFKDNVLVMEFIGDGGASAPKLRETVLDDPENYFKRVIGYIRELYGLGLVHGDLSEYNILDWGEPVLIDFSTGVLRQHPRSGELLERDVKNVVRFFEKCGVTADVDEVLASIKKKSNTPP